MSFENQPKWTEVWIKKMWYRYSVEYYSVIKKKKARPFAATQRDRETVTPSEASQTEKDK